MVFICGAPRSGTTYLYQCLSYHLEVGYINNLVARFMSKPALGVLLMQALELPKVFSGHSDYGVTSDITEPHEFGRGWAQMLDAEGLGLIQPAPGTQLSDAALERLSHLAHSFEGPVVFKSFAYLWHIRQIDAAFPQARWVFLNRPPQANAGSLAQLYRNRMEQGNTALWQSAVAHASLDFPTDGTLDARCARQVADFTVCLNSVVGALDPERVIQLELEDLSRDPFAVIETVRSRFGIPLSPPERRVP